MALDIRPGDVIAYPFGIKRQIDAMVVHSVHRYDNGSLSIRQRYLSNPRGIDWSGFLDVNDPDVRVLSRGVCRVDECTRSLLP